MSSFGILTSCRRRKCLGEQKQRERDFIAFSSGKADVTLLSGEWRLSCTGCRAVFYSVSSYHLIGRCPVSSVTCTHNTLFCCTLQLELESIRNCIGVMSGNIGTKGWFTSYMTLTVNARNTVSSEQVEWWYIWVVWLRVKGQSVWVWMVENVQNPWSNIL